MNGGKPIPRDINEKREIAGTLFKPASPSRGFLLKNGSYTFFDCYPGASTVPLGINKNGVIAGLCDDRGFVYSNGATTLIEYPGATRTRVFDINATGDLVGDAFFEISSGVTETKAFLWRAGQFLDLSFPGSRQTTAVSINDLGKVVGTSTIVHASPGSGAVLEIGENHFIRNTKGIE